MPIQTLTLRAVFLATFLPAISGCGGRSEPHLRPDPRESGSMGEVCLTVRTTPQQEQSALCGELYAYSFQTMESVKDNPGAWTAVLKHNLPLRHIVDRDAVSVPDIAVLMLDPQDSLLTVLLNPVVAPPGNGVDHGMLYGDSHSISAILVLREGEGAAPWYFGGTPNIVRGIMRVQLETGI